MTAFAYALAGQIVNSVHARINLDLYLHLEQQKQTKPLNPGSFLPAHPAVFLKMPALPLSVKYPVAVTVAAQDAE
jgi:hypothetical protein